ncbi:MAG TPA: hypothetical protein VK204_14500 [Nocardioidaceae bacterium]|nr:hypothetical protein [Nocardioidaceae bacterium]
MSRWMPYFALSVAFACNGINLLAATDWFGRLLSLFVMSFMVFAGFMLWRNRRAIDAWHREFEERLREIRDEQ